LIENKGRYVMDFDDLEKKVKDKKVKLLIMSNPHNPVGRVWKKEELEQLGKICLENGVLVISDEIHGDLVFDKNKHIPFAKISDEFKMNSITCMAPSKTFNIAGLHSSYCIIPNEKIRERFIEEKDVLSLNMPNVFSKIATESVYKKGKEWMEELLSYLESNMDYVIKFLNENIPQISTEKLEGTYLMWLNCKELNLTDEELDDLFVNKAGIALDSGHWFGKEGSGYMRLNIACPRKILENGMNKLKEAVENL
jgi:cystathionine beta-lyase